MRRLPHRRHPPTEQEYRRLSQIPSSKEPGCQAVRAGECCLTVEHPATSTEVPGRKILRAAISLTGNLMISVQEPRYCSTSQSTAFARLERGFDLLGFLRIRWNQRRQVISCQHWQRVFKRRDPGRCSPHTVMGDGLSNRLGLELVQQRSGLRVENSRRRT